MSFEWALWWPLDRLGDGLEQLARAAGLCAGAAQPLGAPDPGAADPAAEARRWIDWAGAQLGLELEPVECPLPGLGTLLRDAGPAVLPYADERGLGFFLQIGPGRLLAPDGGVRRVPRAALRDAMARHREAPHAPAIDALLAQAAVTPRRRAAVRAALLAERLAGERIGPCWMLRLPAGAPLRALARAERLPRRLAAVLALFAAGHALEIAGWRIVGEAALDGRLDFGWIAAWLLMLGSLLPLRVGGAWLQARFALDAGRLLKARLFAGALRLDLDRVRVLGVGQWLGRVIEAQALEALAIGGALAVAVALVELALAGWVLAHGAAPGWHLALLGAGLVVTAGLAGRYAGRLRAWTTNRLDLTERLVEDMVGHRTRLAQERPARRDAAEDLSMQGYLQASAAMDRAAVPLFSGVPAGWSLLALAALAPAFTTGGAGAAAWAVSLGGVLLAQRALGSLAGSGSALARAAVAWRAVREIFVAGRTPAASARPFAPADAPQPEGPLVDAAGLGFRHAGAPAPALAGVDLRIDAGERLLLEGPSGGGKSTLAALLTGLRTPQQGLLLLGGLDRPTLGDEWHRRATSAPQFHENHVFSGTLAFNLLLGRDGPPSERDLQEAEALARALGLGELLDRMPAGLQQRVGESGWQLSHGEQSRLFLARALLQDAPLTVLDESFAALDPATLQNCLRVSLVRARTLVVIAHP